MTPRSSGRGRAKALLVAAWLAGSALRAAAADGAPAFGSFVSAEPAPSWQHALLTGNGTVGAMILGAPFDEQLHVSHAALFLPNVTSERAFELASRLPRHARVARPGAAYRQPP